ncbi:carbon-nitrogen hydrolase [Granulicella sp. L46]|jgi:N-carbamoylputrescine amidase|uniref:carbon-nitrogen hydrolase n=1 Tax=Granulicella sp. L46 TaxID=1641865 RepID=UPI00131D404A|nr:carbon-nitrogen hydrolase [Granulicella sp. L46]
MATKRVALIQMSCEASTDANLAKAVARVQEAAQGGAKVVCLPELFRAQYFCQREDHALFSTAEPIPGPSTAALSKVVREYDLVLIASLFERRAPGLYHNTAAILDHASTAPDNIASIYRKMHIPDDPLYYEKFYFTPGDLGFLAQHTSAGPIGTLVCWDQWYPEGARVTALKGAETLFFPTAIGWHPSEKVEFGERQYDAWQTIQRSHAIANGVFVCAVNRVGHEHGDVEHNGKMMRGPGDHTAADGIEFWGGSFIADPFGRVLAKASHDQEEILYADLDANEVEVTRQHWPFLRDRRIDAYSGITSRFLD